MQISIWSRTNAVEAACYFELGWGAERLDEVPYKRINSVTRHARSFRTHHNNALDLQRTLATTIRQLNPAEEKEC